MQKKALSGGEAVSLSVSHLRHTYIYCLHRPQRRYALSFDSDVNLCRERGWSSHTQCTQNLCACMRSLFLSLSQTRMDRGICKTHTHLLRLQRSRQQQTLPSHPLAILSLLLLVFLCQAPTLCQAQCSDSVGCFPSLGNLARGRTVETDSQCSDGDFFCLQGTTDCSNSCRSSSHSASSINDGNNGTAWISSIGSASSSNATLQLDFQEPVLFEEMTLLWKSSRPRSMVLERSRDRGLTWEVYRYYSTSCETDFGLEPMNMVPQDITSTDAICTASQSTLFPNTNAEVRLHSTAHMNS